MPRDARRWRRGRKCATNFDAGTWACGKERSWPRSRPQLKLKRSSRMPTCRPGQAGQTDAYDRIVRRYYGFVRLKASSYFLAGGDGDDLIQEGLVGLYKAVRDYRTDRESSFRNFAELCITRQIITAVKTATRNKHAPLNQYVSFSQTPAGASRRRADARRDPARPDGPRPGQPGDLLGGAAPLVACLSTPSPSSSRACSSLYLDGRSYERSASGSVATQDRRQRAAAGQAQGRRAPRRPELVL